MAIDTSFVTPHLVSVEEFLGLLDHYDNERIVGGNVAPMLELLDGLVVDMPNESDAHTFAVAWLHAQLLQGVTAPLWVLGSAGLILMENRNSAPRPDVMVHRREPGKSVTVRDAELIVEVSLSSLRKDLIPKARIYARHGIPEYWVFDIEARRIVRHRRPSGEAYTEVDELRAGDTVRSLVGELQPFSMDALLAEVDATRR